MDFSLSPELKAFREEVGAFLDKESPEDWHEQRVSCFEMSGREGWVETHRAMAEKLGARGWLSRHWPLDFGGRDASPLARLILLEELARRHAPGYDAIGAGSVAPVLLLKGTDTQKRRHLPGIAGGSKLWCAALSEPGHGSDLAAVEVFAGEDGDAFVADGRKTWATHGHLADWSVLLARTDREAAPQHKGLTCFLVDMKTPGITVNPIINMAGYQDFGEVCFEGARIPKENIIGGLNQGWSVAMALLDYGRTADAAYATAAVLLEDIAGCGREYDLMNALAERRYAGLVADAEVARLLHYRAALLPGQPSGGEAAQCKLFGYELLQRVAGFGMELLGERGQLIGDAAPLSGRVPSFYLRSVGFSLEHGTSEINRDVIARRGLGLPRRR